MALFRRNKEEDEEGPFLEPEQEEAIPGADFVGDPMELVDVTPVTQANLLIWYIIKTRLNGEVILTREEIETMNAEGAVITRYNDKQFDEIVFRAS